jgi:hypothetical protein
MNWTGANHTVQLFRPDLDGLAQQCLRADATNRLEAECRVAVDGGDHHTDLVHVCIDEDAQGLFATATFAGDEIAHWIDVPLVNVRGDEVADEQPHLLFGAGYPDCLG